MVRWLHDETGLTWDQLGRIFGVSRRAVHLWASGGRMNSANLERLHEFYATVKDVAALSVDERRSKLLMPNRNGRSILDEFRARNSGDPADKIAGSSFTPDQLLGAKHDDVREIK
jgi:hypothetical protein